MADGPHRSFTTPNRAGAANGDGDPDAPPAKGPSFDLGGTGQLTGREWREEFQVVPVMPYGALDDLTASVGIDARGRRVYNQVSLVRFFRDVLVDEDVERFDALMHDKDRAVEIETLGAIMEWLTNEVSEGHPTGR